MRGIRKNRELVETIVSIVFILLFMYTAINKIREYEIFQVRLNQSPLLEGMGEFVAVGLIVALLVTSSLLMFQRSRKAGLIVTLGLMVAFTIYIAVVLGFFSSTLPCSCNGVFESMNWKQHLWFNLFFTALAGLGIFLFNGGGTKKDKVDLIYDTDM